MSEGWGTTSIRIPKAWIKPLRIYAVQNELGGVGPVILEALQEYAVAHGIELEAIISEDGEAAKPDDSEARERRRVA